MKDRGLEDVCIFSTDNLPGFSQAMEAVYPKAEIQKCIIHQIRNSTRYVSYKDRKNLIADLKPVYKANTEEIALKEPDEFEKTWGNKYPSCVSSCRKKPGRTFHIFQVPSGY